MAFKAILRGLVERTPGATGAIMLDRDGEAVADYTPLSHLDLPIIGAHQGIILKMIKRAMAGRSAEDGAQHIGISTDVTKIAISTMQEGYYLILLLDRNRFLGRAFMESRKAVMDIEQEMGCPVDRTIERIKVLEKEGERETRRARLIEDLNRDLEWEYASAIQYLQHAVSITGAVYESIKRRLLTYSHDEMEHAVMLSDQINFLGGAPTVNVERREVSLESLEMLQQDLKAEENAIRRYKERIGEAESLREYGLRRILEDILLKEEEHKRELLTVIGD